MPFTASVTGAAGTKVAQLQVEHPKPLVAVAILYAPGAVQELLEVSTRTFPYQIVLDDTFNWLYESSDKTVLTSGERKSLLLSTKSLYDVAPPTAPQLHVLSELPDTLQALETLITGALHCPAQIKPSVCTTAL